MVFEWNMQVPISAFFDVDGTEPRLDENTAECGDVSIATGQVFQKVVRSA